MAKTKTTGERGVKTKLIREGLKKHPDLKPKELAEQLTKDHPGAGVEFRPIDISLAKHQIKKAAENGHKAVSAASKVPVTKTPATSAASSSRSTTGLAPSDLQTLSSLAERAGGITPLVEVLQAIKSFSANGN